MRWNTSLDSSSSCHIFRSSSLFIKILPHPCLTAAVWGGATCSTTTLRRCRYNLTLFIRWRARSSSKKKKKKTNNTRRQWCRFHIWPLADLLLSVSSPEKGELCTDSIIILSSRCFPFSPLSVCVWCCSNKIRRTWPERIFICEFSENFNHLFIL